jgi:hypothetical protein
MNCFPINDRPQEDNRQAQSPSIASQYALANLVRYARRGAGGIELAGAVRSREVLFIDESTPVPETPERQGDLPSDGRARNADVFYIGPE